MQVTVYQCLTEGGAVAVLHTFIDEDVCTPQSSLSFSHGILLLSWWGHWFRDRIRTSEKDRYQSLGLGFSFFFLGFRV
jgi:hypothetical protein